MTWLRAPYAKILLLMIAIALPSSFLIAIPWLKQQPDWVVYVCTGIVATGTIACSLLLAMRQYQRSDEWHRSAVRFSSHWGWLAGGGLVVISLSIPQLQVAIVALSGRLGDVTAPDERLVMMTFILGVICVIIAQTLCAMLFGAGWRFWMSRPRDWGDEKQH